MTSIVLRTGWLALGLQCVVALAQDDDGATRAQRAADNPLRLIIEAGKLKPRAKGDDADASAKPAADPKAVAPRPVAAKAAAPQVGTLPDVLVPDVAPVDAATPAPVASAPAEVQPRAAPKIVGYVAPVLPDRVRRRLQGDGEVVLDFVVNPDGTVRDVAIRSASDKALETVAIDAVRQWRYEPIATAHAHGAQLVFKLGE